MVTENKIPTIEEEIRALTYGTLTQGYDTIEDFANKIRRAGKLANYRDEDLQRKFLDGLVPEWLEKAEDIGGDMTFDELSKKLAKIELIWMARVKRNKSGSHTYETGQAISQPYYSSIAPAIPDAIPQQPVADMQKMIQDALAKQQAESDTKFEKLKAKFETKMTQQSKKSRPPVPPKDYEQMHNFYEGEGDPRWSNLSREKALQWVDKAFPPPVPSKPERLRSSNQNARMDRIESKVDEIG
ncbi:hypothetical protein C2G38_2221522 [Gigaspora rosea]|uniref:Uncharacterized protein n=1 Tax=Gigaspora rosea TaxID=44941 RepID=A0A397U3G3_9GLOM|nr:hypothetical protein C2G38_2221522 [Gigaspora rosea]